MKKNCILYLKYLFLLFFLSNCQTTDYPYFIKKETGGDHGLLWVANSADNTVTAINRIEDKIVGTYPVGPNPSRTAVDLEGNCWVGSRGDGTVYFVTQDGKTTIFEGFNAPRGVALDQNGDVWIANSGSPTIQKISVAGGTVSQQVRLSGGSFFYGALVDSKGFLWIADPSARQMIKYDTSKFPDPLAFERVSLGSLYGFTIDPNGKVWVAGSGYPTLYKIDANSATIDNTYTVPADIFGGRIMAVSFDINGKIWVTNDNTGEVIRFDPVTEEFVNFPVNGSWPHGLGADDAGFIYTINHDSNNISKIDATTGEVVTQYTVGRSPYTYSDLTGFIYRKVTLKNVIKSVIKKISFEISPSPSRGFMGNY